MDILTCMENLNVVKSTQNLKEASQELFIEQSTLSKRISRIENHFNTQLVNKEEGVNRLTTSGEVIANASIEIQSLIAELNFELEHLANGTIATTTEHYLRSSLIHLDSKRLFVENKVDKLIEEFNQSDISCLIIEELYEDDIKFSKKVIFSEEQLTVVSSHAFDTRTIDLCKLNDFEVLINPHASYSHVMQRYIRLNQKKGLLNPDLVLTEVSNTQTLLVDLLLNPHKVFIFRSGIIVPNYLENKLHKCKISLPHGKIKTYKYFK